MTDPSIDPLVTADHAVTQAEPATPEKITFSELQQAKIADIVRGATTKARSDFATLQAELDAIKKTLPPPAEDVVLELATTRAERDALRAAQRDTAVTEVLRAAVGTQQFVDSELACNIMRASVQIVDGKAVVVDAEGNQRLTPALTAMTPADLANELAASKPFLVRSQVRGGSGSVPSRGTSLPEPDLSRLFGKGSDGAAANRLALRDPVTFKALRREAISRGLI